MPGVHFNSGFYAFYWRIQNSLILRTTARQRGSLETSPGDRPQRCLPSCGSQHGCPAVSLRRASRLSGSAQPPGLSTSVSPGASRFPQAQPRWALGLPAPTELLPAEAPAPCSNPLTQLSDGVSCFQYLSGSLPPGGNFPSRGWALIRTWLGRMGTIVPTSHLLRGRCKSPKSQLLLGPGKSLSLCCPHPTWPVLPSRNVRKSLGVDLSQGTLKLPGPIQSVPACRH